MLGKLPSSKWTNSFKLVLILLLSIGLNSTSPLYAAEGKPLDKSKAHKALFIEGIMPAASTCAQCHPKQYDQWSMSQHAYAQLSPVYHTFQAAVNQLTNNTNGDFCIRCHTPVGMNIDEPLFMNNLDRHPTSREGITCITCHRVDKRLGKITGRLPIIQGDMTQPVYGPTGNANLAKVLTNSDISKHVKTNPKARGRKIHGKVEKFDFLSASGFCALCHDVTLVNGFRLEEAFSEYKSSPAAKRGESCQDCHMGKIPGIASGYDFGSAAKIKTGPKQYYETPPRKLTDHRFVGPDHSIIHPGLFPHNPKAEKLVKTKMANWLSFDYKANWGSKAFEKQEKIRKKNKQATKFPAFWKSKSKRKKAWKIIQTQTKRLDSMADARKKILKIGYVLGDPMVESASNDQLAFKVSVQNGTDGHNVPTGFTGERLVWLQVNVTDADGKIIFKSGDLDPNGDVRDLHSRYVHNGELPLDKQLFSLQSKFITRNSKGGEREQVLAVNYSGDPLPFLRPDVRPTILSGRILGARIHKQSIEPNGLRWAKYTIDSSKLTGKAPYTANIKLNAAMIPINLVAEIAPIGFDYGMSARDIADNIIAGHQTLWEKDLILSSEDMEKR